MLSTFFLLYVLQNVKGGERTPRPVGGVWLSSNSHQNRKGKGVGHGVQLPFRIAACKHRNKIRWHLCIVEVDSREVRNVGNLNTLAQCVHHHTTAVDCKTHGHVAYVACSGTKHVSHPQSVPC